MTRTRLADGHRQVGVRLPEELYAAVEKHLARMQRESAPGVEVKLADAMRNLVTLGIEAAAKKHSS